MERHVFDIRIALRPDGLYEVRADSPAGQGSVTTGLESQAHWLEEAARLIPDAPGVWRSGNLDEVSEQIRDKVAQSRRWDPRTLGEGLYREIFTGELRRLFHESRGIAGTEGGTLAIELHLDLEDPLEARLATLPWELLYDPERRVFLAQSETTPVVRYLRFDGPSRRVRLPQVLRILVVTSSPEDLPELDMSAGAELAEPWPQANLVVRRLVDPDEETLRAAIQDDIHVLHFEGHGQTDFVTGEGQIALVGADGQAEWLSGPELGSWLLNRPSLRLVVLNACSTGADIGRRSFSGMASALVRAGVPAVLAMRRPIEDGHAVRFARELYSRLMDGRSLEAALSSARHELQVSNPASDVWSVPTLLVHTQDVFHIPADERPALTKAFSWLGVVTANVAVNLWAQSQSGPQLPGFSFENMHEQTAPLFGVLFVAPLLLLMLYVLLRYQRLSREPGLYFRFPIAFGFPISPNRTLASAFQATMLVCLVAIPVFSQVHFMRLLYHEEIWEKRDPDKVYSHKWKHLTEPISPWILFSDERDDYRLGPRKSEAKGPDPCERYETCAVTVFPFWQPWFYVVMEFVVAGMFLSFLWGIWGREPLRWSRLLRGRSPVAIVLVGMAAILSATPPAQASNLDELREEQLARFEERHASGEAEALEEAPCVIAGAAR
ncbi:MAG: CHAT domain-containing protein [Holophagales bacterium]|nr:CHAT domain-containing protein [Holophagales bacterium]